MRVQRSGYAVIGLVLLLTLVIVGLVWHSDRVGARVVGLEPADGAEGVSSRTAVRITFADSMDRATVENRFQVVPSVKGSLAWVGNMMTFRPTASLTYDQVYTATLQAGAQSQQGRRIIRDVSWSFRVGQPHVIYLARDEQDHLHLFAIAPNGSSPAQLTHEPFGLWDYAVHPEGTAIAYSVLREDEGADLWLMDRDGGNSQLLLACPGDSCTAPAWSAGGTRLAYERRESSSPVIGVRTGPLASRIWLLDSTTGDTAPLFEDDQALGHSPSWSPAGQRLAFYSPTETAVQIYDFATGEAQSFNSLFGHIGSWGPQGDEILIPDVAFQDEQSTGYIARWNLTEGTVLDISTPTATGDDAAPSWSPTGEWIAVGRSSLPDGTRTLGRQLWLLRPDGSQAFPLVTDAEADFLAFAWRSDGKALAYVRLSLQNIADPHPEVWALSLTEGQSHLLATNAIMPGWLP